MPITFGGVRFDPPWYSYPAVAQGSVLTIEKGYAGKRARTWVTLTRAGQAALAEEIAQLKLLISQIERTSRRDDGARDSSSGAL